MSIYVPTVLVLETLRYSVRILTEDGLDQRDSRRYGRIGKDVVEEEGRIYGFKKVLKTLNNFQLYKLTWL